MNGNRKADVLDVLFIARRAFNIIPAPDSNYVLDINKNGSVNIADVLLMAKKFSLIKLHDPCP